MEVIRLKEKMALLSSLPTGLLRSIFMFLDLDDVRSLGITCKKLHYVAQEIDDVVYERHMRLRDLQSVTDRFEKV